jgi:hypothetical protein
VRRISGNKSQRRSRLKGKQRYRQLPRPRLSDKSIRELTKDAGDVNAQMSLRKSSTSGVDPGQVAEYALALIGSGRRRDAV